MEKRAQLKTKQELLKMGYEYNDNPQDFLNLMSGQGLIGCDAIHFFQHLNRKTSFVTGA